MLCYWYGAYDDSPNRFITVRIINKSGKVINTFVLLIFPNFEKLNCALFLCPKNEETTSHFFISFIFSAKISYQANIFSQSLAHTNRGKVTALPNLSLLVQNGGNNNYRLLIVRHYFAIFSLVVMNINTATIS